MSCLPSHDGVRPHRVAVVTGSRAEFGLLEPVVARLHGNAALDVALIAAGMHLDARFGNTVRDVEECFTVAARVPMSPPEDNRKGMALAVAQGMAGMSALLAGYAPPVELLLVLGDRTEAFAAALGAAYLGVPIVHIHGGDTSGNVVDDFQRDTISRLAALHFPATARSARRLRRLAVTGAVEVVGAPGLDRIVGRAFAPREAAAAALDLPPGRPWLVVLHHPLPEDAWRAGEEMDEVLAAALAVAAARGHHVVVVFPNNDAGCGGTLAAIDAVRARERVHVVESLPRGRFLELLHHAELLIGNSSAGVIESAALGVRVVNVGRRQEGRERDGNVVDAPPERGAIARAVERALADPAVERAIRSGRSVHGDGRAAERIERALLRFLAGAEPPARDGAGVEITTRRGAP